jgi:hypothetical protein
MPGEFFAGLPGWNFFEVDACDPLGEKRYARRAPPDPT